ncbi:hypothetical protein C7B65_22380 [Phormidesmis priestleyi ULC007]|uniref:Uncharacterized protein n=1 Tax=Phormidesmis priestleyi ULC007 TaxID=1920490 RepID=A0A2T1D6T1_9CYAN|nr:hypothetical protein [Phormidesmis priestleyi]PSB16179.1 hypothetical protein C7B65_22380 [Phormidesmis priestleyi ULC007]PZO46918.1 MAG: hypothetical protein DCF14_21260 [Phormidesmis priestleyi]
MGVGTERESRTEGVVGMGVGTGGGEFQVFGSDRCLVMSVMLEAPIPMTVMIKAPIPIRKKTAILVHSDDRRKKKKLINESAATVKALMPNGDFDAAAIMSGRFVKKATIVIPSLMVL